jgi:hypothetical protein
LDPYLQIDQASVIAAIRGQQNRMQERANHQRHR